MIMRRRAAVRTVGRLAVGTAVVAGTAGAVHHHQDQKYAQQDAQQQAQQQAQYDAADQQAQMDALAQQNAAQQQQIAQMQAQQAAAAQAPAPAPAAAPAGGTDLNSQLMQLAQLHNAGVLNDEEFAQAKAKLLAGG